MSLKFCIYLTFIFYSLNTFATLSHLSCSKNGTHIMFINGVNVGNFEHSEFSTEASAFFVSLDKSFVDSKNNLTASIPHNRSEGLLKDTAETFYLYAYRQKNKNIDPEPPSYTAVKEISQVLVAGLMTRKDKLNHLCGKYLKRDENGDLLNDICKNSPGLPKFDQDVSIKDACCAIGEIMIQGQSSVTFEDLGAMRASVLEKLQSNQKVILVTHSAGSMFADRIRDFINQYYPKYKNLIGTLSLARPFRSNHKERSYFLNSNKDPILKKLRSTELRETPIPNLIFSKNCDAVIPFPADYRNHEFSCYLTKTNVTGGKLLFNTSVPTSNYYIKDFIYRIASEFENNDENCCNKAKGKVWRDDWYCNNGYPDLCQTSFVSAKSTLDIKDSSMMNDSFICGKYVIQSQSNDTRFGSTRLLGAGSLTGEIMLSATEFDEESVVNISTSMVSMYKTKVKGTSKFSGNGSITMDDVQISGKNDFRSESNSSWLRLWRTNIFSNGENLNYIYASGLGDSGLSDSSLGNKFNLNLKRTSIYFSNMLGETKLNGNFHLYNFHNDGAADFINLSNDFYSSVVHTQNYGTLNLNGPKVGMENVLANGTNTLTGGSNSSSSIYKVELIDSSLSGNFYVNPNNRQVMKNLYVNNPTIGDLVLWNNSWGGSLTLNGSMNVGANNFGNNVVVNSYGQSSEHAETLLLFNSTVGDGLHLSETGTVDDCVFEGTGSSYQKTCTESRLLKFPSRKKIVFDSDYLSPVGVHETNKQFLARINRLNLKHKKE